MANTAQAKKRARQNEKRRQSNASNRSNMRTYLKRTTKAASEKKAEVAQTEYQAMTAIVDKLVTKGLIHKNKAARLKSRLNKLIATKKAPEKTSSKPKNKAK